MSGSAVLESDGYQAISEFVGDFSLGRNGHSKVFVGRSRDCF